MITKLTGRLVRVHIDVAHLAVDPFEYEVSIPEFARRQLQHRVGETICLHTLHYLDGNPAQGRLTPRLIGFLNEVEREFFELICSVDGVGAKKALRAMVQPVADVATAIEEQDVKGLSALPGIGPATAERMIAKLRRKVPKFALLITQSTQEVRQVARTVVDDTYEVLRSLGHNESDARRLVDGVIKSGKKFTDVQEILHAIYEQNHAGQKA